MRRGVIPVLLLWVLALHRKEDGNKEEKGQGGGGEGTRRGR